MINEYEQNDSLNSINPFGSEELKLVVPPASICQSPIALTFFNEKLLIHGAVVVVVVSIGIADGEGVVTELETHVPKSCSKVNNGGIKKG